MIPFLFVFSPTLILKGAPVDVALAVVTAAIGVWLISAALAGYFSARLSPLRRGLFALAGALALIPAGAFPGAALTDIAGVVLGLGLIGAEILAAPARGLAMTEARTSLEKVLSVLGVFTEDHLVWTPDEMIAALGYPRPTLYRYLKILKASGLVASSSGGGYTLGPKVVEMDFLLRKSDRLVIEGTPHLRALAAGHPCSTLLVRWYGHRLLCVASERSDPAAVSSYPRGRPMPLARGAISRAIMAWLPRRQLLPIIEENLADYAGLGLGHTVAEVLDTMKAVRRAGFAVAHGEVTPGVIGIAAPVFDGGSAPIAAICMTSAARRLDPARIDELGRAIAARATALSARLTESQTPRPERPRQTG